ncbi:MAG: hypothetical protein ACYC6G_15345 [Desulfobaccales bacterium]
MNNIVELIKYIRYQLSQLRSQNKHHEFEHLTRHFARLRVSENIIPATGPVGAGGDQGRDFESYRTYLSSTPIATSTFLSSKKDKKFVFACSLKQDIVPKIKADILTICGGPQKIDEIFYFCEADVPVGKRHELQERTRDIYKTELEVYDGQALSEQLINLDVFWIAQEFLDIPSEMYPRSGSPGNTYEKYKQRWLTLNERPFSYSDFFQVKYGLRRATFRKEAKPDLLNWINKMEVYLDGPVHSPLRLRGTYEISVAALRGLNNLTEKKNLVEDYFSQIFNLKNLSDIQDAAVLLSYCSSAYNQSHFDIEVEKLFGWSKSLIDKIENRLDEEIEPGSKCQLLQIRGHAGNLQFRHGITPEIGLAETFEWWSRLLKEVDKAPLFPLEHFADLLTIIAQVAGEDERFIDLTQKTDELLEVRSSGYIAAEKCRDRAMAYFNISNYLLAIKQLHNAKIKWFSAETIRGALLSMLTLSACYLELDLIYPAKYYASCVAFLAFRHDDEKIKYLIPRALFMLANICYKGGEWLTFAHIIRLALVTHHMFDERPLDIANDDELQIVFGHAVIIQILTKRFDESLERAFNRIVSSWPIDDPLREDIENLGEEYSEDWGKISIKDIWDSAQTQLSARPFSDVGQKRIIFWKALGIDWKVIFDNEYLTTVISEEFVSTLQIILADIANRDLVLLPMKVIIYSCVINELDFIFTELPDNEVATWRVGFPRQWIKNKEFLDDLEVNTLGLAFTILEQCSVLNHKNIMMEWEKTFSEGLLSKAFIIRPYSDLYVEFLSEDIFNSPYRGSLTPLLPDMEFESQEKEQLKWIDSDGPGYSEERAKEFNMNRYKGAIKPIRLTLPRLLKDDKFRRQIQLLRSEGYLDWEILLLVSSICLNYRLNQLVTIHTPLDDCKQIAESMMSLEENEDDIEIPASIFTQERIESQKKMQIGTIAMTWGLVLHQNTPDFNAIEKLLDARYHNSEGDVEHKDIFPGI